MNVFTRLPTKMLVLIAGFLDFVSLKLALVCVPEIRGDIDLEGFFRDLYKSALGNSEVGNRRTSRVLAAGVVQSVVLALGNKQLQLAGLVQCVHAEVEKCWQRRDQESDLLTDEQLKPCIVDSLLAWCRKSFLDAGNVPSAPTVVQRLVGCASLSDLAARLVYILAEAKAKQTRKPRKQREHAEAQAKQTREPREQREQFWLRCAFHVTQSLERFWERRYHQLLTEVNEQRRLEKKVADAEQKKAKAKAKAEAKAKANGTVIVAALPLRTFLARNLHALCAPECQPCAPMHRVIVVVTVAVAVTPWTAPNNYSRCPLLTRPKKLKSTRATRPRVTSRSSARARANKMNPTEQR